jgi:parallel beta-helix repeat protein
MGVEFILASSVGNMVQGNYIGIDVTGTAALGNGDHGVFLGMFGNTIGGPSSGAGNVISGNHGAGIAIFNCGMPGNQILGNLIGTDASGTEALGNTDGVSFILCSGNTLIDNTVSNNVRGVNFENSSDNQIYNNNFIDNGIQANVYNGSGNVFNMDKPIGGNYWSDLTGPDVDGDGFVDNPYIFSGGQDNLPWVCQDGWENGCLVQQLVAQVKELGLAQGIENSLEATLKAAARALDNHNVVAAINALEAFINEIEAQRGKKISDAVADALIAAAQEIIYLLMAD